VISSIRLRDFQAHSDLTVEFDGLVTTIVGPSDCGKSSVIRALRWACLNVGVSSLIRDGAKKAEVSVVVDDAVVKRGKSSSDNIYVLDDEEFRAFRTEVPQSIEQILNIDEISFQNQHDPVYWFSSTSGDVSRQLNAVVDLEIVDRALAAATSEYNKAKNVVQMAEDRLAEAKQEKLSLLWVTKADEGFVLVESLESSVKDLKTNEFALSDAILRAAHTGADAKRLRQIHTDGIKVVAVAQVAGRLQSSADVLSRRIDDVKRAAAEMYRRPPSFGAIDAAYEDHKLAVKRLTNLQSTLSVCRSNKDTMVNDRQAAAEIADTLRERMDGVCPICGKAL